VWPGLAGTAAPAAIALIGPDGRDADIVAIGGGRGEGTPVAAPPAPATSIGRCWVVDTDDNASDFWRQAVPTPGEPNACDRR
ncbi:MAG: hypothetical protein QME96_12985, partial [Myxococcota bacterium]|nr:hypothetical protein [Myxococcota bacterium]